MLVVMLPMMVMVLLVLVLHVVHRERHGCIGRRLVQQNGRCWSRGAAGGGHLPNLGHCALVADRTDFVVLLHVSHAGCMSKKVFLIWSFLAELVDDLVRPVVQLVEVIPLVDVHTAPRVAPYTV
uniref:(northern house mosquito) hypothetical protein n=1 Tax=Culex pipiens TaxID=7175 RepID=A0A8D8IH99_CULPI